MERQFQKCRSVLDGLATVLVSYEGPERTPHANRPRRPLVNEPSENTLPLRGDHITLAQAVKVVGLATSGGHAKHLVREGLIRVNGVVELQPGRKLRAGDRFGPVADAEWVVAAEPNP